MNYNESTGEVIRRSVYEDMRKKFSRMALNWNGIWKCWANKSPAWEGTHVGGKKPYIVMNETIPYELRFKKYKDYEGLDNEVDNTISEESSRLHTVGNENNIRKKIGELNKQLTTHFNANEYANKETIEKRVIKSYQIKMSKYDSSHNLIEENICWTDSYQTFNDNDIIVVYSDADLKNYIGRYSIISTSQNPYRRNEIKWTGERYYVNQIISVNKQPDLIGEETTTNVSALGVKKISELQNNPNDVYQENQLLNNPYKTAFVKYESIPNKIEENQKDVYTFDNDTNWKLNRENVVKKSDYQQIQKLLEKMQKCLSLRDKWFDSNDRCVYSCQVACQNTCQISCQLCNTHQCHDQKCGVH